MVRLTLLVLTLALAGCSGPFVAAPCDDSDSCSSSFGLESGLGGAPGSGGEESQGSTSTGGQEDVEPVVDRVTGGVGTGGSTSPPGGASATGGSSNAPTGGSSSGGATGGSDGVASGCDTHAPYDATIAYPTDSLVLHICEPGDDLCPVDGVQRQFRCTDYDAGNSVSCWRAIGTPGWDLQWEIMGTCDQPPSVVANGPLCFNQHDCPLDSFGYCDCSDPEPDCPVATCVRMDGVCYSSSNPGELCS